MEGKDLSDSRKEEEVGLEHINQLQSCILIMYHLKIRNKCNDRNCSFYPDYFYVRLVCIWYETYNPTPTLKHLLLMLSTI